MKMFHRFTIATIDRFTKTLIKVENWFVGYLASTFLSVLYSVPASHSHWVQETNEAIPVRQGLFGHGFLG